MCSDGNNGTNAIFVVCYIIILMLYCSYLYDVGWSYISSEVFYKTRVYFDLCIVVIVVFYKEKSSYGIA